MEFGKLNFAVGFNRTSAFPLDANSYFESYDDAVQAASGAAEVGSSDSAYYIGQLLIVKDSEVGVGLYQINAGKTLTKFGQASSADELASKVSALETRCTTIEGKLILATTEKDGLMSKEDKAKLDGVEAKITAEADRAKAAEKTNADAITGLDTRVTAAEGKLAGITGAMHFVGTSTTDPSSEGGATVEGVESFKSGDVCLFGKKEFVYNGTKWIELGDEGSHLTKTEAASTYVPLTRTINGKALSENITLAVADIGAAAADHTHTHADITDFDDSVNALVDTKVAAIPAYVLESPEDGKLTLKKGEEEGTPIAIKGWENKQDKITLTGDGLVSYRGGKWGVEALPQATADALGAIKIGHEAAAGEASLKLDEEGKAYVEVPAAVAYTAKENGGLELDENHAFSIKAVSTDLLKQGAKTLVLDGGTAVDNEKRL